MPTRLIELIEHLPAVKIVLVGDLMLDRYIYGNAERLSNDAPVPVLHFQREESRLGGAGRVAADLATLGANVHVVSICGSDQTGQDICKLIALANKGDIPIFVDPYQLSDYSKYAGATAITPNRAEAEKASNLPCSSEPCYQPLAEKLLHQLSLEAVVLTLDKDGSYLATKQ